MFLSTPFRAELIRLFSPHSSRLEGRNSEYLYSKQDLKEQGFSWQSQLSLHRSPGESIASCERNTVASVLSPPAGIVFYSFSCIRCEIRIGAYSFKNFQQHNGIRDLRIT